MDIKTHEMLTEQQIGERQQALADIDKDRSLNNRQRRILKDMVEARLGLAKHDPEVFCKQRSKTGRKAGEPKRKKAKRRNRR